jgi:hypothetical protein
MAQFEMDAPENFATILPVKYCEPALMRLRDRAKET